MTPRNIQTAFRGALAVLCAAMALSLLAQFFGMAAAANVLRRTQKFKKTVKPLAAADVKPRDLSSYRDLDQSPMFGAPPQPGGPAGPPQLDGVMAGFVLIQGKMCAEGDEINGWKIVRIDSNSALVRREKEERRITVREEREELSIDNRGKNPPPQMAGGGPKGPQPPTMPGGGAPQAVEPAPSGPIVLSLGSSGGAPEGAAMPPSPAQSGESGARIVESSPEGGRGRRGGRGGR